MRRLAVFGVLVAFALAFGSAGANPTGPLAGYRCAGAGTLTATYQDYEFPPGWTWQLNAAGACALSPDGPWTFTASGRGFAGCDVPALTESPDDPYSPMLVTFSMTNPKTGATRTIVTHWTLVGAYAEFIVIRSTISVPSCYGPVIGPVVGAGVMAFAPDPAPLLSETYEPHGHPMTFAVEIGTQPLRPKL